MNKYELFPGIYANQGQTEALDLLNAFLRSDEKVFLLEGRGGTGKTTIIKHILKDYPRKYIGITVSHKAKKVLGRSIGKKSVSTVASALVIRLNEHTGEFKPDLWVRKKKGIPLQSYDLIIIDECSMISQEIMNEIKECKKKYAKVIFMGDAAQIPAIGANGLSPVFNIKNGYTLLEKMRQAANSPIIGIGEKVALNYESENCELRALKLEHRVNQYNEESDSSVIFESDEDKALDEFAIDFRKDPSDVNNVKAVTFNNENHKNPQSVKNLNEKIRKKLWGDNSQYQFVKGEMLTSYSPYGDEMNLIFNNSEDFMVHSYEIVKDFVVNVNVFDKSLGPISFSAKYDVVYLTLIDEDGEELKSKVPVIANSSKVRYQEDLDKIKKNSYLLYYKIVGMFGHLEYGYAISTHKSQGSSYTSTYVFEDNILGPSNVSSVRTKNQSLYVAVSRPRKKLVMVSKENKIEVKPKNTDFKIKKEDSVTASIKTEFGEIIRTITDSGFTSFKQIIDLLIYRSECGPGKFIFEFTSNGQSKIIKQKIV
jgi:exodeoxyribonuclease-5